MQLQNQPQIKSFRLTTKKKFSIKCYSQQKSENNCSEQSSFSSQYNLLTKKLKIKTNIIKRGGLGSTVSTFSGINSFRVRTQSSYEKNNNENKIDLSIPYLLKSIKKQQQLNSIVENNRYSTPLDPDNNRNSRKIKLQKNTNKMKHNFKIKRPSIYWQTNTIRHQGNKTNQILLFLDSNKNTTPIANNNKNQQLKLSQNNLKSKLKILQNCKLLWNIRSQMKQKNNKIKPKQILKCIKVYIMRKQQKQDIANSLQKIFINTEQQNDIKQLIITQKIFIIGIVQLINLEKVHCLCLEFVNLIDNLIGFYMYLLRLFMQDEKFRKVGEFQQYHNLHKEFVEQGIEQKKCLTLTLLFLCTKLQNIYRYSPELLKRLKPILLNAKKASINRSFYDVLTKFAVYLNQAQSQNTQNSYISKHMASFTTCPSPFIIQSRKNKNYTLVLDLDQTLLYTKFQTNSSTNYCINYRPYSKQFISNLSKYYQIIIFTSSISSYAQQVVIPFINHISHILCRQHTIKVKGGGTIKDLSRIGRSLQSTIIVDNIQQNFKLNKDNGIKIKSWYGEKNDEELYKLEPILLKIIKDNCKDVREFFRNIQKETKLLN